MSKIKKRKRLETLSGKDPKNVIQCCNWFTFKEVQNFNQKWLNKRPYSLKS